MICDRVAIIVEGRIALRGRARGASDGERKLFDVSLSALPADFAEELESRYGALSGRGERVELRVAEKQMRELVQAALARGARVEEVTRHREDLESLFLRGRRRARAGGEAREATHPGDRREHGARRGAQQACSTSSCSSRSS